jgi:uncharacterized protein YcfL
MKLTAAFALLFAAGCATSGSSAPPEYLPNHVNITNADLASDITRLPVTENFTPTGLLTVNVPLRANTDLSIPVDYRFYFLDANGQPVDTQPAWQTMMLQSNAVETLTGTSPVPGAKDFRVDIRPAE